MNNYSCVLIHHKISEHRLEIFENLEYKRILLLSLEFHDLDEELLKNYVIYRFTKIKMNKQIINKKLKDVFALLKIKNPQILMELNKKEKLKDNSKVHSKNYWFPILIITHPYPITYRQSVPFVLCWCQLWKKSDPLVRNHNINEWPIFEPIPQFPITHTPQ